MARPKNPVPAYKLHKPSGQARVRIGGRDVYLGRFGSPESKAEYERICAELRVSTAAAATAECDGPQAARHHLSLNEVLVAFLDHAEGHYRRPDGTPTNEIKEYKLVVRPLRALYGHAPGDQLRPARPPGRPPEDGRTRLVPQPGEQTGRPGQTGVQVGGRGRTRPGRRVAGPGGGWPNRLRCGTYVSFSGRRGTLKSTIARELTARYTKGEPMPACDRAGMPPGHVVYITAEDSPKTVWAGLDLAGADQDKVSVLNPTLRDGDPLNILDHLAELRMTIRQHRTRLIIVDGQNSVVGAPNISTDMLARHNVTNKLHQFAQKENICLIGIRNEDMEGRALGPQSMGDLARCILRAVENGTDEGNRYFRLIFERISDAAPVTPPPLPYSVEDLGGSSRRILWGKAKPKAAGGKPQPGRAARSPVPGMTQEEFNAAILRGRQKKT